MSAAPRGADASDAVPVIDVAPDAELIARVTQEMSVEITTESGPVEGMRIGLRPGLGRQAIRLPSPQPWVMLVAAAR